MRIDSIVLLMSCFLVSCDAPEPTAQEAAPANRTIDVPLTREMSFFFGDTIQTNPLETELSAVFNRNAVVYVHQSFAESLIAMVNPEALRKYEGSYSADDFDSKGNRTPVYSFNTAWIWRNKSLPKVGIQVARNPITGKYEVNGGEVFLPNRGMGVSFEKDEANGETQTFLNWKRDF